MRSMWRWVVIKKGCVGSLTLKCIFEIPPCVMYKVARSPTHSDGWVGDQRAQADARREREREQQKRRIRSHQGGGEGDVDDLKFTSLWEGVGVRTMKWRKRSRYEGERGVA